VQNKYWYLILEEPAEFYCKLRSQPEILIGKVFLDKYKVTRFLGAGGWSTVYEGIPLQSPKVAVAIKIPHGMFLDDQDIARFRREARALSQLRHRNTVTLIDYGVLPDERPYLITELAQGITLEELFERQRLEPATCIELFVQICDVLQESHSIGFVHRDLKPANVIVNGIEAPNPVVKVIDFGAMKSTLPNASVVTRSGETLGTPYYMSPEQCMAKPIDCRTDIYSIGCMLYEALTGVRIFEGKNPMEVMQKQILIEPKSFADQQVRNVPAYLEEIVMQCLKKDPEERFQSAADLKHELERKQRRQNRTNVLDKAKDLITAAWKIKL
jgi:eukaryotic-like serine/threonine-protein kinase